MKLLFLLGCIPLRLLLVYLTKKMSPDLLVYHGVLLLAISLSFLWLYFTNGRMNAPEAGGFTWWSKYRLIHGMLYLTAAIYALQKNNLAYIPLLIDVILGFILALLK